MNVFIVNIYNKWVLKFVLYLKYVYRYIDMKKKVISGLYNLNFESKIFWIFVRVLFLVCMSRNFSCEICLKDVKVFIIIV